MIPKEKIESNILEQLNSINLTKKSKKKSKKKQAFEDRIQMRVVSYVKMKYPEIIYKADTSSGGFMTIGMAMKNKKLGGIIKNFPDFSIFYISFKPVLFLELKKDGIQIYKKNGDYYKNEHYINQSESLKKLETAGYAASFGIGFEHCKILIDAYMNNDEKKFNENKIV